MMRVVIHVNRCVRERPLRRCNYREHKAERAFRQGSGGLDLDQGNGKCQLDRSFGGLNRTLEKFSQASCGSYVKQ